MNIIILWEVVAAIGFGLCAWLLVDAWLDFRALMRDGRNGSLKMIANNAIRIEAMSVVISGLFLLAGYGAEMRHDWWPLALLAGSMLFSAKALLRRWHRHRLRAYLDKYGQPRRP